MVFISNPFWTGAKPSCVYEYGRCIISSAEAEILMAINNHGPTPPVRDTHYHRQTIGPNHYCTQPESETPLTYTPTHCVPSGTNWMVFLLLSNPSYLNQIRSMR
ncbi:hypothetical protein AVEN_242542-1 [Araneus ventricosus]|uniref:Uncharacterized protein n=1 Tax=Araneus ventricosus TaxID=182803 RepID=A0A4Y2VPA6_ARAVE|nr:hypothetical protein AVEN_242542-1 [Araneus ventricosus]